VNCIALSQHLLEADDNVEPQRYLNRLGDAWAVSYFDPRSQFGTVYWFRSPSGTYGWTPRRELALSYPTREETNKAFVKFADSQGLGELRRFKLIPWWPVQESADPDDIDVSHYLGQLYTSDVPGYRVEKGEMVGTWYVYHDIGGQTKSTYIGTITYDPMDDMPPEAVPVWKDIHWFACAGWRDEDRACFRTFTEAFHFMVKRARAHAGLPESANPDDFDLENYAKTTHPGEAPLLAGLRKFYSYVGVHRREASVPIFKNQTTWIVTCRRDTAMPLPNDLKYDGGGQRFKNLVYNWLIQWAGGSGLYLMPGIEFHGRLRSNVTMKFDTAPRGGGGGGNFAESLESDMDDPEKNVSKFVKFHNWEQALAGWLRDFDPYGTFYHVPFGNASHRVAVISVTTYFPPDGDENHPDFQRRLCDNVRQVVGERLFPVDNLKSWVLGPNGKDYRKEWHIWITVNIPTFNPRADNSEPNITWEASSANTDQKCQ